MKLPKSVTKSILTASSVLVYFIIPEYVLAIRKDSDLIITAKTRALGSMLISFSGMEKLKRNK
jgi:hypothetical protein